MADVPQTVDAQRSGAVSGPKSLAPAQLPPARPARLPVSAAVLARLPGTAARHSCGGFSSWHADEPRRTRPTRLPDHRTRLLRPGNRGAVSARGSLLMHLRYLTACLLAAAPIVAANAQRRDRLARRYPRQQGAQPSRDLHLPCYGPTRAAVRRPPDRRLGHLDIRYAAAGRTHLSARRRSAPHTTDSSRAATPATRVRPTERHWSPSAASTPQTPSPHGAYIAVPDSR